VRATARDSCAEVLQATRAPGTSRVGDETRRWVARRQRELFC